MTSTADFDLGALAKHVYAEIGYKDDVEVFVNIDAQSAEMKHVHNGVTDNAVVNGFATSETRELLPRAVVYAHNLARRLDDLRKTDPAFSWLKPDGKIQLTMDGGHVCAVTVLASHQVSIDEKDVKTALLERLLVPILGEDGVAMYINPIGTFIDAGFKADSGASGRKMTVDTYGGLIPHGDKSISGKDPSRVDRAAAYMARYVARYLVEQGLAHSAMVSLVYSMGRAEPVHIQATGMGGKMPGRVGFGLQAGDLTQLLKKTFDFRPEAIAERLNLFQPVYRATATYGHFGRAGFPWEESLVV